MSLEWEIHEQLKSGQDLNQVAETLAQAWTKRPLSFGDRLAIASFLLNTGRKQILGRLILHSLDASEDLPWAHFVELCSTATLPPEVSTALLEGAEEQNLTEVLFQSAALDRGEPAFAEKREKFLSDRARRYREDREVYLEKIEYLKNQRMFVEEGRAIADFAERYSDDPLALQLKHSYEERWAREILAQKSAESLQHLNLALPENKTETERKLEQSVSQAVLQAGREHPAHAYDLSILLCFLELYEPAQEVLRLAPPTMAKDWFGLELMLKGRRFVEALEECQKLAQKYAQDPEVTFSVTYSRARALYGLGQTDTAAELMKSIVQIRPEYRSARLLLNDWTRSAF